jgi:hypothetical protein
MGDLLLRGGEGIEPHRERVELRLPVTAVAVEPERGGEDRPGIEPAAADPATTLLRHQPCAHQHMDVARHRLQRNVERRGDLCDEQIFAIQSVEYRAPNRVGERTKHLIQDLIVGFGLIHDEIILNRTDDNQ